MPAPKLMGLSFPLNNTKQTEINSRDTNPRHSARSEGSPQYFVFSPFCRSAADISMHWLAPPPTVQQGRKHATPKTKTNTKQQRKSRLAAQCPPWGVPVASIASSLCPSEPGGSGPPPQRRTLTNLGGNLPQAPSLSRSTQKNPGKSVDKSCSYSRA